jgi:acyl carrier protein
MRYRRRWISVIDRTPETAEGVVVVVAIDRDGLADVLRVCDRVLALDGPATADTSLLDEGIDSIEFVGLLTALEQEFDVVIPLGLMSLRALRSPQDLWELVRMAGGTGRDPVGGLAVNGQEAAT